MWVVEAQPPRPTLDNSVGMSPSLGEHCISVFPDASFPFLPQQSPSQGLVPGDPNL